MSQSDIESINVVDLNQFIYSDKKIYSISLGRAVEESSKKSFSSFKP